MNDECDTLTAADLDQLEKLLSNNTEWVTTHRVMFRALLALARKGLECDKDRTTYLNGLAVIDDERNALAAELAELRKACERPVSKEGRPMNRRSGRMVRASELLKEVGDIIEKWGDTCFYITGLSWGSVALWAQSDYEQRLAALLARTPEEGQ